MSDRSEVLNGKRDYYEVLGVSREATDQEIKKAYRRIALQHHPDRNPENKDVSEETFKEAAEAYSVLSDPQKRAQYNRYGRAGVVGSGGSAGIDPSTFSEFSDILGDFFGFGDLYGTATGGRRTNTRSLCPPPSRTHTIDSPSGERSGSRRRAPEVSARTRPLARSSTNRSLYKPTLRRSSC